MTHPRSLAFLGALASLATLAFACQSQYEINQAQFCREKPNACGGSAGAAGDANGDGGTGGGENGTAGVGGTAGTGGDGGTGGISGMGGTGGGGCEAGKVACGADCRDVAGNDPENCGACDRSCRGSACNAGVCDVQLVVTGEVAPYALAKNDTSLFWVSPARKQDGSVTPRVRGIAKEPLGGVAQDLINQTFVRARSLAFFEGFLYWGTLGNNPSDTASQRLARGAPDAADGIPVASGQRNIQHVVAGPQNRVYWTALNDAAVRAAPLEGGTIDPNIASQGAVSWVAVDQDAQPYWISTDTREVRRQVPETPNPTTEFQLVATANAPVSVELGNGRVYWADRTPGAVRSAPKDDFNAAIDEFAGKGPVEGFALEGTALVVITLGTDELNNKLLQVWRRNEGREPLLLGQVAVKSPNTYGNGNPFGAAHVLLDGDFVYFADVGTIEGVSNGVSLSSGDGSLYRVAK